MRELRHPDPPLTDGVVVLRALTEADVPALVEACADPLIARFISSIPQPYGLEQARAFLTMQPQLAAEGTEIHFAVVAAHEPSWLLGVTGLHDVVWRDRRGTTGYWLAPWGRGRGMATRALQLVSDWALGELGLVRLGLLADVENEASQRVAERVGFEREGVLRRYSVLGGVSRDCVVFGRIAAEPQ